MIDKLKCFEDGQPTWIRKFLRNQAKKKRSSKNYHDNVSTAESYLMAKN